MTKWQKWTKLLWTNFYEFVIDFSTKWVITILNKWLRVHKSSKNFNETLGEYVSYEY